MPSAPRRVFGFDRSAITPTEHADTPDCDEASDSDQSSHLNNHGLTSVLIDLHRTSRRRKPPE